MMSLLSVPASPSTAAPTSHLYRLRKALIPLLCFVVGFNINFGGIYHDISDGSFGGHPIIDATKEWKSLMVKEKETLSLIIEKGEKDNKKDNLGLNKDQAKADEAERRQYEEESAILRDHMKRNIEDYGFDPWANQVYDDDSEDEEYWCGEYCSTPKGTCWRNTTITDHYRPPNITHTTTTATPAMTTERTKIRRRRGGKPIIPRRLIFTYHTNLFDCTFPPHLYDNVQKTIQTYADLWGIENKSNVEVMFFDDQDCARVIEASEPKLVPIFWAETNGSYRADICRIAALYMYGGYYLDVDIEPIQALDPLPQVDFITAQAANRVFFQAVMASTPRHPLMKHTLETMLVDWYMIPKIMKDYGKTEYEPLWFRSQTYADMRLEHVVQYGFDPHHSIGILMGPATLRIAYDRKANLTTPWLLDEFENKAEKVYPALIRETSHWGCNFMVHDNATKTPYFYSRCKGTANCPNYDEKKKSHDEKKKSYDEKTMYS
ncbi:unnamed protein product [Cylindrotheca closterium]|uniref:Uncharacterized protein n=1 Tax=Cylindrotheca closterium TaxID=2856 RepID=A0AAD2FYW3_9STRA|nr:unnamed protein product [Cylindrotheca closterium]